MLVFVKMNFYKEERGEKWNNFLEVIYYQELCFRRPVLEH